MIKNRFYFKKLIKLFFGMIFFLVSTQVNAENCNAVYEVTATQLNVRSQASVSGSVIATLHRGIMYV